MTGQSHERVANSRREADHMPFPGSQL